VILLTSAILIFILFGLLAPKQIRLHHKKSVLMGLAFQFSFLFLGYGTAEFYNRPTPIVDLENSMGVICRITQTPVAKTKSYKSEAFIEKALIDGNWINIQKKMIIYCPLDSSPPFQYDDVVFIDAKVNRPKLPANPHQFNYKKYLEKKGIFYQTYVKDENVRLLDKDHHFTIDDFEEACVQYTRKVFYTLVPDSGLSAIATALLVGFQEELDPETKTSFSRVGAMHILAVSGLHVGIIFILLSKILFFLDRNKYTKILKAFILILFLWGYAIIAGFSPSIVRASLMFTLLIPILSFKIQGNAYNNIASSAFILLLYNSNYLFDVGFQLSYVAVFGILYLYPLIKNWVESKYWLVDQIWQLTAVSIAATIFTCPIVFYNFGQFPASFLISNLVAVPVSTLIIYVGIGALICFKIPIISMILGKTLYGLLWFLKWSVEWIESLPYSYIDHLLINRFQAFLLYLLIFSLVLYFQYRKVNYFKFALCILCFFTATLIQRRYEVQHHKEVYIYNLNKSSYVEYINGHNAVNVLDETLSDLDFGLFVRTNHQHAGVFRKVNNDADLNLFLPGFQIRNTKFFLIEKNIPVSDQILETDYLILSNIKFLDVDMIAKQFKFKQVILLNNHSFKKQKKLEELLTGANIPFYSLAMDGCFRLKY
jgi:competence protein ComEC